jgi:hypothetical protein
MTPKASAVALRIGHATIAFCMVTAHTVDQTTHGQTSGHHAGNLRDGSFEIRMSGRGGRLVAQ